MEIRGPRLLTKCGSTRSAVRSRIARLFMIYRPMHLDWVHRHILPNLSNLRYSGVAHIRMSKQFYDVVVVSLIPLVKPQDNYEIRH